MTNTEHIAKIKAEIERMKGYYRITNPYDKRAIRVCENLLSFLSTLESEKPVPNDLEEAKEAYCEEHNDECFDAIGDKCSHIRNAFIAGAKWQKEQMMKEAVEGEIQMRYSGCLCAKTIHAINEDKFKFGDKVKIIIVKEEKP